MLNQEDLHGIEELNQQENQPEMPPPPNQRDSNSGRGNMQRSAAANLREPDVIIDLDEDNSHLRSAINHRDPTMPRPIVCVDLCGSPTPNEAELRNLNRRIAEKGQSSQFMWRHNIGKKPAAGANDSVNDAPPMICAVCFEKYYRHNPTFTKCGHVFCSHCILEAIRLYQKCPVCNKQLTRDMLTRAYF